MKYAKYAKLALIVSGVVLLSACTRSVSNVDSQGKTNSPIFPDASHAVRSEGSFVNLDNLKQMRPGLSKAEVYELIGTPHFDEGVFRVKEWDYIFHFTKPDNSVLTCQYKVLFDSNMKAQSFFFAPDDCLSKLNKPVVKVVANTMHKELSAEGLFSFGSPELSASGVSQVNDLAADLKAEDLNGKHVVISGYTDRIGNSVKNMQLSLARAESVKKMLTEKGIPASIIETQGLGDSAPRVVCPGKKSPAVIECLAPNRRMTIDVVAIRTGK
ncbi:OmpA family protein [Buttiauxella noackiae]|uniref:OmpA family protein n=1 Tax=Buttiauxella noackiae TaxID=82992 RepID=UPI0023578220|nr:OmpA family protein [Buttiauxella noackiae]MCA1923349.1 outer membrane protein assembly factor BamE [Buttiauxella noackiae]